MLAIAKSPNDDNKRIGARIRDARLARNLHQVVLAKALGLTVSSISKKERGEDYITAPQLAKLSRLLKHKADWFLQDLK